MWYLLLYSWCPWILYFSFKTCGLAFYRSLCYSCTIAPQQLKQLPTRVGTAWSLSGHSLTREHQTRWWMASLAPAWIAFSHFEIKMFWRVCLGLLMNISSQVEKAHRGMPHKQPFHKLTHPLCSSGVYTGEDRAACLRTRTLSDMVFLLLFGFVDGMRNGILTWSLRIWYMCKKLN